MHVGSATQIFASKSKRIFSGLLEHLNLVGMSPMHTMNSQQFPVLQYSSPKVCTPYYTVLKETKLYTYKYFWTRQVKRVCWLRTCTLSQYVTLLDKWIFWYDNKVKYMYCIVDLFVIQTRSDSTHLTLLHICPSIANVTYVVLAYWF